MDTERAGIGGGEVRVETPQPVPESAERPALEETDGDRMEREERPLPETDAEPDEPEERPERQERHERRADEQKPAPPKQDDEFDRHLDNAAVAISAAYGIDANLPGGHIT